MAAGLFGFVAKDAVAGLVKFAFQEDFAVLAACSSPQCSDGEDGFLERPYLVEGAPWVVGISKLVTSDIPV